MATAIAQPARLYSAEEVQAMPDGDRYELIHGELKEPAVSVESSRIGGKLFRALDEYLEATGLGEAFPADLQLHIWSDSRHLRKPDAAVVLSERLPGGLVPDAGFLEVAPDIVGEVVSVHDDAEDVAEKVSEYLAAGVRLMWVAYPRTRSVYTYRADGSYEVLGEGDELDGSPALPGFRMPVAALFKRNPRA